MDVKGDSEDAGSQQKTGCECPRPVAPQSIKSSSASPDAGGRRARRVSLSPPPRLKPCLSIACLVCDPAVCFRARRAERTKNVEVTNRPIEFRGYSLERAVTKICIGRGNGDPSERFLRPSCQIRAQIGDLQGFPFCLQSCFTSNTSQMHSLCQTKPKK